MISTDYNTLKVPALKELLSQRGLSVLGKKAELVERLFENDEPGFQNHVKAKEESTHKEEGSTHRASEFGPPSSLESSTTTTVTGSTSNVANNDEVPAVAEQPAMSFEEKLEARKKRFGIVTENERKLARAKRFDLATPELENEKKVQRMLRFGLESGSDNLNEFDGLNKESEEQRRKQRMLRFGFIDEDVKQKKRMERFGSTPC